MRNCLASLILGCCLAAEAHIGAPNVFLEDKAGEYPVRVVIRPPTVVPGLAEITVRVQEGVQRVTVLPVFWKAGREGAPPPDVAKLVRGETNLYSAELWLMQSGAYSVDVTVEGARGKGTLIVPVNAMATNTRPMPRVASIVLSALAVVLFLGGLKLAGAIITESRLEPGVLPTSRDHWRGRAAMGLTAIALALLVYGGKKWWDLEDRDYHSNALYKPLLISASVRSDHDQPILSLRVDAAERRGRWTPLITDHGKLMHLFLVHDGAPSAFAHLHPVKKGGDQFEVPLPPLPAGRYNVYADVTHEDGFSETLIATTEIPTASVEMKKLWLGSSGEAVCSTVISKMLATNLFFPPDADDSWWMDYGAGEGTEAGRVADASGGYKIVWQNPEAIGRSLDTSLQFQLLAPNKEPAPVEPYMGMLGHAVVRRQDGSVFAHIHPVGTFSMAAQQFFVEGKSQSRGKPMESNSGEVHENHTNAVTVGGISFPFAFPQPGPYRLWVQMKSQGRILTGVFDTVVK